MAKGQKHTRHHIQEADDLDEDESQTVNLGSGLMMMVKHAIGVRKYKGTNLLAEH